LQSESYIDGDLNEDNRDGGFYVSNSDVVGGNGIFGRCGSLAFATNMDRVKINRLNSFYIFYVLFNVCDV